MRAQAKQLISKISSVRSFTDDSYLTTTHFVFFLLIGVSEEMQDILEQRAKEIIEDKRAIAFISVSSPQNVESDVERAYEEAANNGARVDDLNELHFCPVVVSEETNLESFNQVVDALEKYRKNYDKVALWKPFVILNPVADGAAGWLVGIETKINELAQHSSGSCCRCCVMTRRDESGFAVADERLLDTILFVSLLHANSTTREGLARRIAYLPEHPDAYFYTAQTAFVSNPAIIRTLHCIRTLLESFENSGADKREVDPSFLNSIFEPLYTKLPRAGGQVELDPLLAVMPGNDGSGLSFEQRLKEFAKQHYISKIETDKDEIFARLRKGFLGAFINSQNSIDFFQNIIENETERKSWAQRVRPAQIGFLTPLAPKAGMKREIQDLYVNFADKLRIKLSTVGSDIVEEFLSSLEFTSLPDLYSEACKQIRTVSTELKEEVDRRSRTGSEIHLQLMDDPEEKLAVAVAKDLRSKGVFAQCMAEITLAIENNDEAAADFALEDLLDTLYSAVRSLAGGSSAKEYMNLLSRTCADYNSDAVKHCIQKISAQLKFPLRYSNDVGKTKSTYVWGNQDNNFYSAWERQQNITNTKNEFLPINSKERFVILSVSPAFSSKDIRGVKDTE